MFGWWTGDSLDAAKQVQHDTTVGCGTSQLAFFSELPIGFRTCRPIWIIRKFVLV